jgi:aminoglycoside/choline kinase family phosphotransferase
MTTAERTKIDRIKQEFARDEAERPDAVTLDDIPAFYECITPAWLTAVVRRRHPDATVTGYSLDERDSGTSNRRRVFLEYGDADRGKGYPGSLFCKASQDLLNRILMSASAAHAEVTFYNQIRSELAIEAPEAYFAAIDRISYRSIVVLEDLASQVEFCRHTTPMSLARVQSQLDLLATMHGRFYESSELGGVLATIDPFPTRFMRLVDYHDLAGSCDRGLTAAREVMPDSIMARRAEIWPLTLRSVQRQIELPQTLNHGDVHLKNWYIRGGDQMGLNDFQVLNRGHWSRDVAYVLATALTIEDRRKWERELIAYYIERLQQHGGGKESFDASWKNYRQQLFSVLAWWTITMSPSKTMPDMQPVDTTLCFLERIGQAMEDLDVLDSFD